jgi:chemotaxis protein methyltransferase CheR
MGRPAFLEAEATLTARELQAIVELVYRKSGITLHEGKRELIQARLQKRLRHHGLRSYGAYLALVEADAGGDELTELLDAIATNHTSFFREPQHFELLRTTVAPAARPGRPLTGWSAPCSSGEEPYSIAITLEEAGCHDYQLLASDLSTKALAAARRGVYKMERVAGIPHPLLRSYFQRGLGETAGLVRVMPALRTRIEFQQLNLLEIDSLGRQFDFIFCRNVMIYFDRPTRQRVVTMIERHLLPGGVLFIAHAESLNDIRHGLQPIASAAFRKAS